jgi:soluble lytic murein transglycosylase
VKHTILMKPASLLLALSLVACSSSHEASAAGDVSSVGSRELENAIAQSDVLRTAQALIDSGHPWRATQALARTHRDGRQRTPAALIVAARAAAGWDGWSEVDKLLARQPWLDSSFDGEGRELLARSALERGVDTAALTQARAAAADAKTADARAVRAVLLARALERSNYFDSASATYARAANALRAVRDWLMLRAAGTERDSAARAKIYASISHPVARTRVAWTEAQTLERAGDALGAAARYSTLGAPVFALRLRLSVAPDSGTRDEVRRDLIAFIRAHEGTADAKTAVEILDRGFTSLSPADEVIIARSAAASGPPARAVTAFERALSQPVLVTSADRIAYAQVLTRVSRSRDALAQLAQVTGPLAGQAAYQRARVLLTSGTGDQTRAALRDVISRFPGDTAAATAALYLLADLSTDDGNDTQARALFQQLYRGYPASSRAADARFRAAIIAYAHDDKKPAAAELDSLYAVAGKSDEAAAARYWAGRIYDESGNATLAPSRLRDVISASPASYYALLASKRLKEAPWVPPARADSFARVPAIDSAMQRVALLERLGMDVEARFELDALDAAATSSPERLAATAHAFLQHRQPSRAIRLAQKLVESGERDARAYRLLFPLVDRDELTRNARANDLDPALVAGLIRQESSFNPRAVSAANARGLMQVLPAVGEEIARAMNYPVWYPALLLDADANLQLGTSHLASYFRQHGTLPRVLAAYNAGGSRVTRWSTKAGMDDPELFAERIPFVETRDYVRVVQRNSEMYRTLYDWK